MRQALYLACLLLALVPAVQTHAQSARFAAQQVRVIDGDTLGIEQPGAEPITVRLHGIDAPERDQPGGRDATAYLRTLTDTGTFLLEIVDRDRYGRVVGVIHTDSRRTINHLLVAAGHAWWYRTYAPNDVTLAELEDAARSQELGLWAGESPVAPWQWRRQSGDTLPGGGTDRDCADFQTQAEAQEFFLAEGGPDIDPHRLDRDADGVVCESLR